MNEPNTDLMRQLSMPLGAWPSGTTNTIMNQREAPVVAPQPT